MKVGLGKRLLTKKMVQADETEMRDGHIMKLSFPSLFRQILEVAACGGAAVQIV